MDLHGVRWRGPAGEHQTGYLLEVDGLAIYRRHQAPSAEERLRLWMKRPGEVMHIAGLEVLVVPHYQPPHAIQPVWVPLAELRRRIMRSEWEGRDG
jgi:hypothetical protein